jgi:hypothetical protein
MKTVQVLLYDITNGRSSKQGSSGGSSLFLRSVTRSLLVAPFCQQCALLI